MKYRQNVYKYLLALLLDLDGIEQSPIYHPEGDVLFHSLQVFQHALKQTKDPTLLAAALFHDIGKSLGSKNHELTGAEFLIGVVNDEVTWLIEHHLDLMKSPSQTKRKMRHDQNRLRKLQLLRQWDLAGRDPNADVCSAEEALSILITFLKLR